MQVTARYFEYYGGAADKVHGQVIPFLDGYSVTVLRELQQAAAKNHVPCVLELGGKSPQIVFADADIDKAVPVIVKAILQAAGQTCLAGSRLLVQESIYDQVVAKVAERFKQLKVGTHDMDLDLGPVINLRQKQRVERFVKQAVESGVPLLAQGSFAPNLPSGGYFVKPALFGPVPRNHALACDEVFGPVLSALPFKDEEDAIRLANATDYGLVGAVWTLDGGRQQRVSKRLRCGQVYINGYGAGGGVELPFGGIKKSGHGREKGFIALEHMSTTKTVVNFHG